VNSVFAGNVAERGGALFIEGGFELDANFGTAYIPPSEVKLSNSTFVSNFASRSGDAFAMGGEKDYLRGQLSVQNSIVWNGAQAKPDQMFEVFEFPIASIVSGIDNTNFAPLNSGEDPLFLGEEDYDFRLAKNSPARDLGWVSLTGPDRFDLDADGDIAEALSLDFSGLPRDADSSDQVVDVGAFAFHQACEVDRNGDGLLDEQDLRIFVQEYLAENLSADIDGDGYLTTGDIQFFQRLWSQPLSRERCFSQHISLP
jgi:hypothetical protein